MSDLYTLIENDFLFGHLGPDYHLCCQPAAPLVGWYSDCYWQCPHLVQHLLEQ